VLPPPHFSQGCHGEEYRQPDKTLKMQLLLSSLSLILSPLWSQEYTRVLDMAAVHCFSEMYD
jgi:hypothetical protein